ncbi:hypothetical protein U9M48_008276 [Paspalum notatum var. saurae]|uniref:Uncharacterized protein n=1 Tax=Paspalum notatum var. saurae TaxID=547442 RepID=A0AAQ3SNU3_PASNO
MFFPTPPPPPLEPSHGRTLADPYAIRPCSAWLRARAHCPCRNGVVAATSSKDGRPSVSTNRRGCRVSSAQPLPHEREEVVLRRAPTPTTALLRGPSSATASYLRSPLYLSAGDLVSDL